MIHTPFNLLLNTTWCHINMISYQELIYIYIHVFCVKLVVALTLSNWWPSPPINLPPNPHPILDTNVLRVLHVPVEGATTWSHGSNTLSLRARWWRTLEACHWKAETLQIRLYMIYIIPTLRRVQKCSLFSSKRCITSVGGFVEVFVLPVIGWFLRHSTNLCWKLNRFTQTCVQTKRHP